MRAGLVLGAVWATKKSPALKSVDIGKQAETQ